MMRYVALPVLLLASTLASTAAWAQAANNPNNAVSLRPKPEDTLGAPRQAPPPALPGAQSRTEAAPATKPPTDMAPNDALFDAINRGDIAAARDALSRGADLDARNLLGMSPMELSVDLGRNDISFLLLSMRGGSPREPAGGREPAMARTAAPAAKAVPLVKTAARPERTSPVLFANDGGTPVPDAGFLGFDVSRTTR